MTNIHKAVYLIHKREDSAGKVLLNENNCGNDGQRYDEVESMKMMVHFEGIEAMWYWVKNDKKKIQNWLLK